MGYRQVVLQCAKCDAMQPHTQKTPNHVLHALLTLFLLGLWAIVWIAVAMSTEPAVCARCGRKRTMKSAGTVTPTRAPQEVAAEMGANYKTWGIVVGSIFAIALLAYFFRDEPPPAPRIVPVAAAAPGPRTAEAPPEPVTFAVTAEGRVAFAAMMERKLGKPVTADGKKHDTITLFVLKCTRDGLRAFLGSAPDVKALGFKAAHCANGPTIKVK